MMNISASGAMVFIRLNTAEHAANHHLDAHFKLRGFASHWAVCGKLERAAQPMGACRLVFGGLQRFDTPGCDFL